MRRFGLVMGALAFTAGCRNTNEPNGGSTHPAGNIVATTTLAGRPYPVAITLEGRALVGQLDKGTLANSVLPDTLFAATFAVGSVPTDVSLSLDGSVAYVANQYDSDVQALSANTGASIATYPVHGYPFSVAPGADGASIIVTTNVDSVFRIHASTKQVLARSATDGTAAQSLVVDRNANRVYVSTRAAGTILELNADELSLVRRFSPGGLTQEGGLVSRRNELWVANENGFVTIVSLSSGAMSQVDVGGQAWGLAVTPDQAQVWVGLLDLGVVKVIDVDSRQVVATIHTGGVPRRIRFTATGDRAVIANESGWVNVVQ